MNRANYDAEIRSRLCDSRYYHSLEVAKSAAGLAERYGSDPEKAYDAGILHDIMKDAGKEEQMGVLADSGVKLTTLEKSAKKLWHAMSGACYIKNRLHVEDEEIIGAVRYHTAGRAGMTLLEKVIFIADFISADRVYDGVERMREKAKISIQLAMLEGLQFTITELINDEKAVHPGTLDAYNEIVLNMKKEKN